MAGTIWIKTAGNMGNRALQYLVAQGIAMHAPGAAIQNVDLPEWGLITPHPPPPPANCVITPTTWFDRAGIGDCLRRGVVDTVIVDSYPYHMEHYPPRAVARQMIGATTGGTAAPGFGARQLVCSIRGGEIIDAVHPDYLLLPPAYYATLADRSGLDLVFFGQLADDPYCQALRQYFPKAEFVAGQNAEYDFEMLRRSVNIAPSISTFAWLAAWLSEAAQIYLPVGGIFSPVQLPGRMFLPLDDPAYHYTLLPFSKAVSVRKFPAQFALAQDHLAMQARPASAAELRDICRRAETLQPRGPLLGGFDRAYYERRYADVASSLQRGLPSALHHYLHAGFQEGRQPLEIDQLYYSNLYPDAARQIAEGYYAGPLHHYLATGRAKGYQPKP